MFRLLLARHGETILNRETRLQGGGSDPELTDLGKKQAEGIAVFLKKMKITAIVSSPLKRALYTAQVIAGYHKVGVEVSPNLKELDMGILDGLNAEEIGSTYPDFFKQWSSSNKIEKMPGGESLKDVIERAWSVVEDLKRIYPSGKVLIVSHSFVITTIICRALGADLHMARRLMPTNGGISLLEFNHGYSNLAYFNETCHMKGLGI